MLKRIFVGFVIGLVIISVAGHLVVALGNCALFTLFTSLIIGPDFQLYVMGELVISRYTNALCGLSHR